MAAALESLDLRVVVNRNMRVGGSGVQKKEWFYYCTCGPVRLVSDDDVSTSEL